MIDTPRIVQSAAQITAVIDLTIPRDEIRNVIGPVPTLPITAALTIAIPSAFDRSSATRPRGWPGVYRGVGSGHAAPEADQVAEKGASPHGDREQRAEQHDRVDAQPTLPLPVDVAEREPQGELVQGQGRGCSEQ